MFINDHNINTNKGISRMTFAFFIIFFFVIGYLANNIISYAMNKLELFVDEYENYLEPKQKITSIEIDDSIIPVVILGGGSAGFTAAVYTAQAGYTPMVFVGKNPGGAISKTSDVRNWPGEKTISGALLAGQWQEQAIINGANLMQREVIDVDFSKWPFLIKSKDCVTGEIGICKALSCIISVGATPTYLGIPGEQAYWGHGITNCAICDSYMVKDSTAVIIGGGDAAMSEVQILANIAKKIYVLVRGASLRAKDMSQKIMSQHENVKILYQTKPLEFIGDTNGLSSIKVQTQDQAPFEIKTNGAFLAIGSKPNVGIFKNQLKLQSNRCIRLFNAQETSVPGVFAAGDVTSPIYRQAVIAAGDGCRAALQAMKFLSKRGVSPKMFADGKIINSELTTKNLNDLKKSDNQTSNEKKTLSQVTETDEEISTPKTDSTEQSKTSLISEIHNEEEFSHILELAKNNNKIVILDFSGTWCQPCKILYQVLLTIAKEQSEKVIVCSVDVDNAPSLASSLKIRGVPSLVFFDGDGNELKRMIGNREHEEIVNAILACQK